MTMQRRAVVVKQLPEKLSGKQWRVFRHELEACMNVDRPYLVLDCSKVRTMNSSVVHLLLCCLEEAMKRNGDIKLAAIPSGTEAILELTGVNRLFDIFDTTAAAVSGFHRQKREATSAAPVLGAVAARAGENKRADLRWSFWHAQSVGSFEEN
jgi:anti-sigma B factor antagonist